MERDEHFTKAFYERPASGPGFPVRLGEMDGSQPFLYHWHDSAEVLYGLERETSVGVMGQPYILGQGDILIIGPGESHCIFPSGHEARRVCVMFEPGLIFSQDHFAPYRACFSQIPRHSGEWPEETMLKIKDGISRICEESSRPRPGWELMVHASLAEMAAWVLRTLPKTETPPRQDREGLLRRVLGYLSAEYLSDISLDSCAKALGFHPPYLSHQFKAQMGVSFHRYLVNLRLIKAESLLEDCSLPVAQAAAQAGFGSLKTFYRAFYGKHGMSPGDFRKARSQKRQGTGCSSPLVR